MWDLGAWLRLGQYRIGVGCMRLPACARSKGATRACSSAFARWGMNTPDCRGQQLQLLTAMGPHTLQAQRLTHLLRCYLAAAILSCRHLQPDDASQR
jgi:hypothetical protein